MSLLEERSPKRQRTSYSPASPPMHQTKSAEAQSLHTPPPSVHMSPSWQSQSLPSNSMISTPPSTTSFPSQIAKSAEIGETQTETPVEQSLDGRDRDDTEMEDADHRRTDHERLELNILPPPPVLYNFDPQPVPALLPDPAANLLGMYSLQAIQLSVARRDPITGEKINKLRKSYETKSRNLGIEGRNKAMPQEGHLRGFIDPLWDSPMEGGSTMWQQKMDGYNFSGSGTTDLMNTIETAFQFAPGRFPKAEHAEWTQQLGLDEAAAAAAIVRPVLSALPVSKSTNSLPLAKTSALAAGRATAPSSPSTLRPDRAGKKRRYDESSYEGYDDDDTHSVGSAAKRIKKRPSAT